MRSLVAMSRVSVSGYRLSLLMLGVLSLVSWLLLSGEASAANGAKQKAKKKPAAAVRETVERGRLVSFSGGVLKIKALEPGTKSWEDRQWTIAGGTQVVSHIRGVATKGTAPEAFKLWEQNPGVLVVVKLRSGKVHLVEIGAKKAPA